jgi:hypothetical protein
MLGSFRAPLVLGKEVNIYESISLSRSRSAESLYLVPIAVIVWQVRHTADC